MPLMRDEPGRCPLLNEPCITEECHWWAQDDCAMNYLAMQKRPPRQRASSHTPPPSTETAFPDSAGDMMELLEDDEAES